MDIFRKQSSPKSHPIPKGKFILAAVPLQPSSHKQRKQKRSIFLVRNHFWRKAFISITGGSFFFLVGIITYSLFAHATLTRSLHFENQNVSFFSSLREVGKGYFQKTEPLKGESEGRVNILLLGRAGENYPGKNLTDTVMIVSIDTVRSRVALLSLPRDLFVPIAGTNLSTKLNSLYQYSLQSGQGTKLVSDSLSQIVGLSIPYTAVIDFEGFEQVIDALGGIRVEVLRDIYDTRYPGKNYSYETFKLKAGWQKLDGKTALKYARERHTDPEGDFGRAKRQQQILQAVADRAFSLPTFLNPFTLYNFLESLGASITTNITPQEVQRFLELARVLDRRNIETVVVDAWKKESLLRVDHLDIPSGRAFILVPRSGTWDEVRDLAHNLFDQKRMRELQATLKQEQGTLTLFFATINGKAARDFRSSLESEFPLAKIRFETIPALDKLEETAIIQDATQLQKPFTLDALIKRYALEKRDVLPLPLPEHSVKDSDFIILFTKTKFEDTLVTPDIFETNESYDFQEPLPPQTDSRTSR